MFMGVFGPFRQVMTRIMRFTMPLFWRKAETYRLVSFGQLNGPGLTLLFISSMFLQLKAHQEISPPSWDLPLE